MGWFGCLKRFLGRGKGTKKNEVGEILRRKARGFLILVQICLETKEHKGKYLQKNVNYDFLLCHW